MAFYAVIMAGGTGTRLWPISRKNHPKQLLNIYGDNTMIADAVQRIGPIIPLEQVTIAAKADYVPLLSAQVPTLPMANFIVEPEGRGTAPAIGLAAVYLQQRDPDAVMAVLTADHIITKTDAFCDALSAAAEVAQSGALVTLGIKPNEPSTGFGYIQMGEQLEVGASMPAYRVKGFTEKPNLETAISMMNSGDFMFNSGMFIWRVDRIMAAFEQYMPEFYSQLTAIAEAIGTPNANAKIAEIWSQVGKETIDYGIMEKAENVAVIPIEIGWHDIGSWSSLPDLLGTDESGNTVVGKHISVDSKNTLVFNQNSDRVVATIGVENLVIVTTDDAILVCPKDRVQDVRAVVDALNDDEGIHWL